MDRRERWKLATHLNVYQLALLMTGHDPAVFNTFSTEYWSDAVKEDAAPFLNAIMNAVSENKFEFTKVTNEYGISWDDTRIDIESFKEWLISRNYRDGFFVTARAEVDPLLDSSSDCYAPKLAAAVRAWKEVTADPEALNGKTPKKALAIWLKKHAAAYGLLDKDGNPIKQALDDICKVANWRPEGGATPTPTLRANASGPAIGDGAGGANHPTPQIRTNPPPPANLPTRPPVADLDDEIPF